MTTWIVLYVQPNRHSNKVRQKTAKHKRVANLWLASRSTLLSFPAKGRVVRRTTTSPSLFSVAIKARAEQTGLFCRAVATKRNEVHLKGFGEDCKYNRLSRLFKPESWVRHLRCKHKNELILWLAPRHRLAQASLLKGRFGGIVNITG